MTYTGVLATIFTGIEPAVALSLACVPFLRPLVKGRNDQTQSSTPSASRMVRSTGKSAGGSGPFKELSDDSSELQLHPMGGECIDYEAEVSSGRQQTGGGSKGSVTVRKEWNIVSVERSL